MGLFVVFKFLVISKPDLFVDQAPKQKEIIVLDLFNCAQLWFSILQIWPILQPQIQLCFLFTHKVIIKRICVRTDS